MRYKSLTLEQALILMKVWSHWYYVVSLNPQYLPARRQLEIGFKSAIKGLNQESRGPILRLARLGKCVFCGKEVGQGVGDHIIPLSKGGPNSAENYMPLCRRCNSSKGNKDLIEWWLSKGRHISDLNLDALVIYLRLRYRLADQEELNSRIAPFMAKALKQMEETIPESVKPIWFDYLLSIIEGEFP